MLTVQTEPPTSSKYINKTWQIPNVIIFLFTDEFCTLLGNFLLDVFYQGWETSYNIGGCRPEWCITPSNFSNDLFSARNLAMMSYDDGSATVQTVTDVVWYYISLTQLCRHKREEDGYCFRDANSEQTQTQCSNQPWALTLQKISLTFLGNSQ